jgi:hypothetical protein
MAEASEIRAQTDSTEQHKRDLDVGNVPRRERQFPQIADVRQGRRVLWLRRGVRWFCHQRCCLQGDSVARLLSSYGIIGTDVGNANECSRLPTEYREGLRLRFRGSLSQS